MFPKCLSPVLSSVCCAYFGICTTLFMALLRNWLRIVHWIEAHCWIKLVQCLDTTISLSFLSSCMYIMYLYSLLLVILYIYLFGCLLMFFLMFCGLLMQIQFARTRLNAIRKAMGKSILSQIWYGSLCLWYWVRAERFTQNSRHYSKRDMCDKFVRSINEVSLCSRISHIQNHFSVHRLVLANASGFCIRIEMLFRVFVNSIETFASKRDKNPHKCTHSF